MPTSATPRPFLVLADPDPFFETRQPNLDGKKTNHAVTKSAKEPRSSSSAARDRAVKHSSGMQNPAKVMTNVKPRDADVDLLEALVTHVRVQKAHEAKSGGLQGEAEPRLASASDRVLNEKLKQCTSADPLELEVCRVRACAGQWGKQVQCLPKKEKISLRPTY